MDKSLEKVIDSFTDNYIEMKGQFYDGQNILNRMGAFILTAAGIDVSSDNLRNAKAYVESMEKRFDGRSRQISPLLSAVALLCPNPRNDLLSIARTYDSLKAVFPANPYLITAACLLECTGTKLYGFEELAQKTKKSFLSLGQKQLLVAGYESIPTCMLYALSKNNSADIENKLQVCTDLLKNTYKRKKTIKTLAQVLALYPEPESAYQKVLALSSTLKNNRLVPRTFYGTTCIGALAGLNKDAISISNKVQFAYHYMKKKSCFGFLSMSSRERLMWACMLVAINYIDISHSESTIYATIAAFITINGANIMGYVNI